MIKWIAYGERKKRKRRAGEEVVLLQGAENHAAKPMQYSGVVVVVVVDEGRKNEKWYFIAHTHARKKCAGVGRCDHGFKTEGRPDRTTDWTTIHMYVAVLTKQSLGWPEGLD